MKNFITGCLAMVFAVSLMGFEISNPYYKLGIDDQGTISLAGPDGSAIATLKPAFDGQKVTVKKVPRPAQKCSIVMLRAEKSTLAIEVPDKEAYFSLFLNRGASPVKVEWELEALVMRDPMGEDTIVTPANGDFRLPPFISGSIALVKNAAVGIIPVRCRQDSVLKKDGSLEICQRNTEDYRFVVNAGKGTWHKTLLRGEMGDEQTVDDWQIPYPARWQAAYPFEKGFVALDDGLYNNWSILHTKTDKKNKRHLYNANPRVTFPSKQTATKGYNWAWHGGYEGSFTFPAEVVDGKLVLRHLKPSRRKRVVYSKTMPVYIYAWEQGEYSNAKVPACYLPPWVTGNRLYRTVNVGNTPTTCATTANFEKLFYDDEAAAKVDKIRESLDSMQCFVESIRARVENGVLWADEHAEQMKQIAKAYPELKKQTDTVIGWMAEMRNLHTEALPLIQQPPAAEKLSAEVVALAQNTQLDDEKKEEASKLLGRKIRTIGGNQDNLAAFIRHYGKVIRQRCLLNYGASATPLERKLWRDLFLDCDDLLQGAYGHDGK